jgi:hypothetical protein
MPDNLQTVFISPSRIFIEKKFVGYIYRRSERAAVITAPL